MVQLVFKAPQTGADVLDIWGQSFGDTKLLTEEAVPFELADNQKMFLK